MSEVPQIWSHCPIFLSEVPTKFHIRHIHRKAGCICRNSRHCTCGSSEENLSGITELRKLRFRFLNLNLSESPTYMTAMSLYTSVVGIAEEKNRKFRQPKYFAETPTYMSDFPKNTSVVGRSILHFLQCRALEKVSVYIW